MICVYCTILFLSGHILSWMLLRLPSKIIPSLTVYCRISMLPLVQSIYQAPARVASKGWQAYKPGTTMVTTRLLLMPTAHPYYLTGGRNHREYLDVLRDAIDVIVRTRLIIRALFATVVSSVMD